MDFDEKAKLGSKPPAGAYVKVEVLTLSSGDYFVAHLYDDTGKLLFSSDTWPTEDVALSSIRGYIESTKAKAGGYYAVV